jgi:hypothetical protein
MKDKYISKISVGADFADVLVIISFFEQLDEFCRETGIEQESLLRSLKESPEYHELNPWFRAIHERVFP